MVCKNCERLLAGTSEVHRYEEYPKFKHCASPATLLANAEGGCRLCLMICDALPNKTRKRMTRSPSVQAASIWYSIHELLDPAYPPGVVLVFKVGRYLSEGRLILPRVRDRRFSPEAPMAVLFSLFRHAVEESQAPIRTLPATLKLAKQWIEKCRTSHAACRSHRLALASPNNTLPFARILDVGQLPDFSDLRLVSNLTADCAYLTLSHCWGEHEVTRLSKGTLKSFHERIPYENLPATFRDAIQVARELTIRYLWIDSLCIVQDEEEDWRQESQSMGMIYSQSFCTLAATAARDGRDGLLKFLRTHPQTLDRFVAVRYSDLHKACDEEVSLNNVSSAFEPLSDSDVSARSWGTVYEHYSWYHNITSSPLAKRAWILQERLLSPRVLHFGRTQLFWECDNLKACELYPSGYTKDRSAAEEHRPSIWGEEPDNAPPSIILRTAQENRNNFDTIPDLLRVWCAVVELYSAAKLTFETDRLAAIAGLASLFKQRLRICHRLDVDYVGGIWDSHLPRQLLWMVLHHWENPPPTEPVAPSWSWTSTNGTVKFLAIYDSRFLSNKDRVFVRIENMATTSTGFRVSGKILVRGRLLRYSHIRHRNIFWDLIFDGEEKAASLWPDSDAFETIFLSETSVFCVPFCFTTWIEDIHGLVLYWTGQKGVFRRCGYFRLPRVNPTSAILRPKTPEAELAEINSKYYLRYESENEGGIANFWFHII